MKSNGMTDDVLRTLGGWRSYETLARYGTANAEQRAVDTYRRLPSPTKGL